VEILNEDGTMARLPELMKIAERFDLKVIAIKDLVAYRMRNERLIKRELSVSIDTQYGPFEVIAFRQLTTDDIHLAIKRGDWKVDDPVLVRVHSSTETGEILGGLFNSYGVQLQKAIEMIAQEDQGLLLYMRHSEKSDAILHHLADYQKRQYNGENPELNKRAEMTQRDFGVGAQILHDMNVTKLRLITNTPRKRVGLIGYGLEVVENITM
jgi:3,4-dihydroxy 2-butanone 4-phosphate synthase/GTP cyclohydrolase II